MKKSLITLILITSIYLSVEAQNNSELHNLEMKSYVIHENECNSAVHNGRACEVYSLSNWFNSNINYINEHEQQLESNFRTLETMDMSKVLKIRSFFLQGSTKNHSGSRAHVLEYTLENEDAVKDFKLILADLTSKYMSFFRKEPWTYLGKENKMYFVLPSGSDCEEILNDIIK